jgi:amidophosphoribosyltransferase
MCGIVGVVSGAPVNQLIYDALLLLQHRGQDAAGIVTQLERKFFMHKAKGMVRDVFRTRNMRALPGNVGLGQVRYPTAGNAYSEEEAQPFYVNAPFGIVLVHNGNLTNAQALKAELFTTDHRHINTESDSEVLLNVFAHELESPRAARADAAGRVHRRGATCTSACAARMRWWRSSPATACWPSATRTASARCPSAAAPTAR